MKKLIPLTVLISLLMLLASSSVTYAGKVYKWVDSEGKIHYSDRPNNGQGKQMYVPRSAPRTTAPPPKASDKMDATTKFLESVAAERKEKKEAADKTAKEKETRDKNCSQARRHVASLKQGGRQFEVDEKGERHYLSEADIQQRLKKAQESVSKWCQ